MKSFYRVLSLCLSIILLFSVLALGAFADNAATDLRRVAGTPLISFRDADGNLMENLVGLDVNSETLSFDSSRVTYGEIGPVEYRTVDLTFSYVDYNYSVESDGSNLPDAEQIVSELEFGELLLDASEVQVSTSTKGYLRLDISFNNVNFFDDVNNVAELVLYYTVPKQMENGDFRDVTMKGNISYIFNRLELPQAPLDEEETNDVEEQPIEITIVNDTSDSIKTRTPYIMIEDLQIGEGVKSVAAGSSFDITLTCRNTHFRMDLENVLMQLEVPSDLKLEHASNSFYLGEVGAKEEFLQTLSFSTSPSANVENYSISVIFSYEYIDEETRREDKITQKITLPVVQGTRFTVDPIMVRPEYTVGEEQELVCSCANLSRTKIYNVRAEIQAEDGLGYLEQVIHLGNFNAGEGGEATFHIYAQKAGTYAGTIRYTCEDEWGSALEFSEDFSVIFVEPPVEESDDEQWQATEDVEINYLGTMETPKNEKTKYWLLIPLWAAVLFICYKMDEKQRKSKSRRKR